MSGAVLVLFWLAVGYLVGSLPTAYLAGKLIKGIDIREHGSGNVGGANVLSTVSKWAFLPVVLTDAAKSLVPTLVALNTADSGWAAMAAGTGAVVGHCWSVYLAFTGGRGMATALGALLPVFPSALVWILGVHFVAAAFKLAALGDILALVGLPLLALALGQSPPVVATCAAILVLVAAKRLHANSLPLPTDPSARWNVLRRRLLYDRDVAPGEAWTERTFIKGKRPS